LDYLTQWFNRLFDKKQQKIDPFLDSLGDIFGLKMGL